ncbi:Mycobacterium terramassiliense ORFan, partial [Mycobacterium terramassiliense]
VTLQRPAVAAYEAARRHFLMETIFISITGRPLLFATVDPEVAAARGVPVRALGRSSGRCW